MTVVKHQVVVVLLSGETSVAVDMVKDIGWFLIFLSLGLFPQFFSAKEAKEAKAARDSKLGKISAQLLPVGFFLWGIAVFAELVL